MDIIKLAVIGIIGVLLALTFRYQKPEYSFFISMVVCILIFTFLIGKIRLLVDYTSEMGDMIAVDTEYMSAILKMIGITYMAEFSANICKDAGYQAIAGQIEMFAKIAVLLLSMPVLFTFIRTIGDFL